jgi:hypothetical protein
MFKMSDAVTVVPTEEGRLLLFLCPNCQDSIIVYENDINCKIFRHAVFKETMEQIGPHTSKEECERLLEHNKIFGCSKPFRIDTDTNGNYIVSVCGYI